MKVMLNELYVLFFIFNILGVSYSNDKIDNHETESNSKYEFLYLLPESLDDLGLESDMGSRIDSLFVELENGMDGKLDNLGKIFMAFSNIIVSDVFWGMKRLTREQYKQADAVESQWDPVYHKMRGQHNRTLFEKILGAVKINKYENILLNLLSDPNAQIRQKSLELLLSSIPSERNIEACRHLLNDEDGDVMGAAIEYLSKLADDSVLPVLKELVKSKNDHIYVFASECLIRFGVFPDRERLRKVVIAQGDSDYRASKLLSFLPEKEDIDLMLDLINTSDRITILRNSFFAITNCISQLSEDQLSKLLDVIEKKMHEDFSGYVSYIYRVVESAYHSDIADLNNRIRNIHLSLIENADELRLYMASVRLADNESIMEALPRVADRLESLKNEDSLSLSIIFLENITEKPAFEPFIQKRFNGNLYEKRDAWIQWWIENKNDIIPLLKN